MNKPTIGLIIAAWNQAEYIDRCLAPWIELKKRGYNIKIAALHGLFKEYADFQEDKEDFETGKKLKQYFCDGVIDYIQEFEEPQTETKLRDAGLQYLLIDGIDFVWLVDPDEHSTVEELTKTIDYISSEDNQFYAWFSTEFKNLTFDERHYTKGFAPSRIFRVKAGLYDLDSVYYDNDCLYKNGSLSLKHQALPGKKIPVGIFNSLHYSWIDNKRSRDKVKYQEKRWNPPLGNGCGFKVNETTGKLEFNDEYYKRIGAAKPEIFEI